MAIMTNRHLNKDGLHHPPTTEMTGLWERSTIYNFCLMLFQHKLENSISIAQSAHPSVRVRTLGKTVGEGVKMKWLVDVLWRVGGREKGPKG